MADAIITPDAGAGYDFSKVNVTDRGVQLGPGQFADKASLSADGYKQAVAYQATKDGPTTPSLLVTSGASRSTYNTNANIIQNAATNLTPAGSTIKPDPNANPNNTSGNTDTKIDAPTQKTDTNGGSGAPGGSTTYPDGSVVTNNGDGTQTTKTATGASTTSKIGDTTMNADGSSNPTFTNIDPALKKQYDDAVAGLDQGIASAKATLDAATATLSNDPAAQNAIAQIAAKYDQQIQLMKDKNTILMGSYVKSAARNGGLQYASDMTTNFLSEEQDRATQRVTDLITQETQMILKAQQAYKDGDVKALDAATKAYQAANKDKIDAINKLLTATNNEVKSQQAQQKIDAQKAKDVIASDVKLSTSLANTAADAIEKSGITDEKTIRAYIEGLATKSGITNPDILQSAVTKAQQAKQKTDLQNENIQSTINKRKAGGTGGGSTPGGKGGGKDGSYSYSADDISTYSNFLNKGGTAPDGTKYNGRGSDTYVDPGAYTAVYNDWITNGGTVAGFLKKFPVKSNVNPDGYSEIPAGLQPKTKTAA